VTELAAMLGAELVAAIEQLIDQRVSQALAEERAAAKRWLTIRETGALSRVRRTGGLPEDPTRPDPRRGRETLRALGPRRPRGTRPGPRAVDMTAARTSLRATTESGPGAAQTARGPIIEEAPPMTGRVYGEQSRRPVVYRGERIAGLYERDTGDGRVMYELRRKVSGKMVRRTLAATTPTDAIREARAAATRIEDGARLVGRSTATLQELRDAFEEWATGRASPLAASTRDLYLLRLDKHVLPALGSPTRVQDVTAAHLRGMIDKLAATQSGSSVRGCVVAASALFRHAVRRGIVATNPVRHLERGDRPSGKRKTEPRYLDRTELDRLLDALGDDMRPVAAVMAFAGLRVSEALALRWRDVGLDERMLDVPGTKTDASAQPVPMTADLVRELRDHRRRVGAKNLPRVHAEALVFPHDRRNVLRAIYAAGDRAGLNPEGVSKVSCHDLRHSCAGLLFSAGVSAPKVAAILRHSDVRVTLTTYAGLVETDRADLRDDLEAALS